MDQTKDRDPAEGPREDVRGERQDQQGQKGAGISNRPIDREQKEQQDLPKRGESREEDR
jgi:hypothetical protein